MSFTKKLEYAGEEWRNRLVKIARQEAYASWLHYREAIMKRYAESEDSVLSKEEVDIALDCFSFNAAHEEALSRLKGGLRA